MCPYFINIQMSNLFSCPLNWSFVFPICFWLSTFQMFLFKSEVTCMELNIAKQLWKREGLNQDAQKSSVAVLSVPQTTECFSLEVHFVLAEFDVPNWVPARLNWPCAGTVFAGAQGLWKCLCHCELVLDYTPQALQHFERRDDFPWVKLMGLQHGTVDPSCLWHPEPVNLAYWVSVELRPPVTGLHLRVELTIELW